MDRFSWAPSLGLDDHEDFKYSASSISLYDGDEKNSAYENGNLIITSHRLVWADAKDERKCLSLDLSHITYLDEESSFLRGSRLVCQLSQCKQGSAMRGPISKSAYSHIKISFPKGGQTEFMRQLRDVVGRKQWEEKARDPMTYDRIPSAVGQMSNQTAKLRTGIAGIERKMQEQQKQTDSTIAVAFEDLSNLMAKAKEMVTLAKSIASKIEQKQGSITEDETVRFKSYLLSLGIPDPVTRDTYKSGTTYLAELSKQICSALLRPIEECGGTMTLADAYCRINRARGMELLSPQDLLDACKLFPSLKLPLLLRCYDSGVKVVQLISKSEASLVIETTQQVTDNVSLSADELARKIGISVILAKERLLLAEQQGTLCRDDSVEGLRFFPNRFLTEVTAS